MSLRTQAPKIPYIRERNVTFARALNVKARSNWSMTRFRLEKNEMTILSESLSLHCLNLRKIARNKGTVMTVIVTLGVKLCVYLSGMKRF